MTIVYSRPNCVQCDATTRYLDSRNVEYRKVNVMEDEAALARIKGLGYLQAPVVEVGETHWSGFRPDMLDKHVTSVLV